ncbi:MAG: beta-galactosidase, partial [bacterium]
HGGRCHFRPLSRTYLRFCARIAGQMARRYGKNLRVIGWQIDNEYNHNSHDPDTRRQFQVWLKVKYRTLERLNARWSGAYWSEDYQDWAQIQIPHGGHNPGLRLEWQRFHSYTYRVYQKVQMREIRKHAARRQWITTNFMGWFGLFDHYEVAHDLDLASWDSYCPTGTPNPVDEALPHDLTRGFKRKNFWLIETQPSGVNWADTNTMQEPGRIRLRNWQAVAHGADAVLYWQWRNALGGQEQLHGSLIGQDGRPRPCFDELAALGAEFEKCAPALEGTVPKARVAFLNSYDARWAVGFQRHHKDYDWVRHLRTHYAPFYKRHHAVDVVSAREPLADYQLVVVPALWVLHDDTARYLKDFVTAGGHLVLTTRTGAKDGENALRPELPPGPLAELAGVQVEEAYPLLDPVPVSGKLGKGSARVWGERLRVGTKDVQVLATFGAGNGWLAGKPAVTVRKAGRGSITVLAGWFDDAYLDRVLEDAMHRAGLAQRFEQAAGVEFAVRTGRDGREILILMNHGEELEIVRGLKGTNLLTGASGKGKWTLAPRDV